MKLYKSVSGIFVCVIAMLLISQAISASGMGISSGHDLDLLWSKAKQQFDLEKYDAIILLEGRESTIDENGDMTTKVHSVVWISTSSAIRNYADLRVPWDSSRSTLNVLKLRTWRDGRWWPGRSEISPTAVVETVPDVLVQADDYLVLRETMLLHDGIELPCIMETEYEIKVKGGAEGGVDDLFIFAQHDPALLVEYTLSVPEDTRLHFEGSNGAGEPEITREKGQSDLYRWSIDNPRVLGRRAAGDIAAYAPALLWSTWEDWKAVGWKVVSSIIDAADLEEALIDTLRARTKNAPTFLTKVRKVASLVDEFTRRIDYNTRFWAFSPRQAERIYETAYAHDLDRAVLAASIFAGIGTESMPIFRSTGLRDTGTSVPGLSQFDELLLVVKQHEEEYIYNPVSGEISDRQHELYGRTVFFPGETRLSPFLHERGSAEAEGFFELILEVDTIGEEKIAGRGIFEARNIMSPHHRMVGLGSEAISTLEMITGGVLPGVSVSSYNPEIFRPDKVRTGFDFESEMHKDEDSGRITITVGDPTGGILDLLPGRLHLYAAEISAPVILPSTLLQKTSLKITIEDNEVIYLPEDLMVNNKAGWFSLSSRIEEDMIYIDRELFLEKDIDTENWPQLRALLLEETDAANRTVILK